MHPGITSARSVRFFLFEFNRFKFFNIILFLYFLIENAYVAKTEYKRDRDQIMLNKSNCVWKSQFAGIRTELEAEKLKRARYVGELISWRAR